MPATQPPTVTTAERQERREADPGATKGEGSWRTLVQRWNGSEWETHSEYPGDWALQWEAVAKDARYHVLRLQKRMRKVSDDLRKTW